VLAPVLQPVGHGDDFGGLGLLDLFGQCLDVGVRGAGGTMSAICTAWPWWGIIPVAKSTSAVLCAPVAAGPALTAEWVDEVPWSTAGRRVYTETAPGASRTALMGMTRPRSSSTGPADLVAARSVGLRGLQSGEGDFDESVDGGLG
jgi:hypothetical protein